MENQHWNRDDYLISTDPEKLQLEHIHAFLTQSYWAKGISFELVAKSIKHSLNFGLYFQNQQMGFARVVSDYTSFAYLGDVYVDTTHRGKGLSKWLMQCIQSHPSLQGLRRFMLATADAHGLYTQFGFKPLAKPERIMEITVPDIYLQNQN